MLSRIFSQLRIVLVFCLMALFLVMVFLSQPVYPSQAQVPTPTFSPTQLPSCGQDWVQCGNNIYPLADSYVVMSNPTTNLGRSTQINLSSNASLTPLYDGYLKFDLGSIPVGRTFKGASLWLCGFIRVVASPAPYTVDLYDVPDTSWQEMLINWNNRPAFGSKIASGIITMGWDSNTRYDCTRWDISSYYLKKLTAGTPIVTFGVRLASYGLVTYLSKEYTNTIPVSGHQFPKPVIQTAWTK